jgi:PAS domain S-box-containing protein
VTKHGNVTGDIGLLIAAERTGIVNIDTVLSLRVRLFTNKALISSTMTEQGHCGPVRDQYEAIAESISDATYLLDTDRRLVYTNQSSIPYSDVSLEAIRDDHVMDFIERIVADSEDPERFEQALETVYDRTASAECPITVELDVVSPTGTTTREYRCSPCETASGTGAIVVSKGSPERSEPKPERYERLFEARPVAVGINTLRQQGQFEFVNQAAVEMFAADSKAELKRYSLEDLSASPGTWEELTNRITQEGAVDQYEVEFTTLDGEPLRVEITAELAEIGGEKHMLGILGNTSETEQREGEIRGETALTDGILDCLRDVFYAFDADGNLVEYNERLRSVTGYDDEELETMTPWEFFPESEREMIAEAVGTVIETEAPVHSLEAPFLTKSGETIPYEFSGAPYYHSDGTVAGFVGFGRDITDRTERDRELQENRERLRRLFDEAPDPMFVQDAEGKFTDVNEKAVEKLGYSREELLEMEAAAIDAAVERADVRELLSKVKSDGQMIKIDGRHQRADGSTYPVEVRASVLATDGEDRFLSHARDISERKQREEELERKQAFLEQTQEVAAVGGWEIDLRSDSLRWTEEVYRIHGVDSDFEPTVEEAIDLYHPEDQSVVQEAVQRATTEGEPFDEEVRIVRPDGEVRWTRARGEPRYDAGDIVGVRGTSQDITDRKEWEQELERHRNVIQAVDDGVYALDENGHFELVNDAMADLTGYETAELLGEHTGVIKSDAVVDRAESIVRSMIFDECVDDETTLEVEIQRADGTKFPAEDHITALWDDDGEWFEGTAGIIRDITERKERERQLQRQNERLDQFAGAVSHDLRNPLMVALARLDIIRDTAPDEHVETMERNLERMEEMIDDLLTLARIDQSDNEFDQVEHTDTVKDAWNHADVADCELESLVPETATLKADRNRLLHVFENLFRNAADHNSSPVTVRVGIINDGESDGDDVQSTGFFIEDDGAGIPDEQGDEVFERGHTTSAEGTGFGLSIVRDIVKQHGWDIHLTEGVDGGARFEVTGVNISH